MSSAAHEGGSLGKVRQGRFHRLRRRMASVKSHAKRGAGGYGLGGNQDRPPLDAHQQRARRGCPRRHVATGEGRRDRRSPDRRSPRAGHGAHAVRLGEAHPDRQSLASQVMRAVRQHPRLSVERDVADEQARREVSRRDRPDLVHGLELSRFRHRQRRQPGCGVSAQLPSGICFGESARLSARHILPAGALRHFVRQLQGDAYLSDAFGEAGRGSEKRFLASSAASSTASS